MKEAENNKAFSEIFKLFFLGFFYSQQNVSTFPYFFLFLDASARTFICPVWASAPYAS